jgi:hypothetical protein
MNENTISCGHLSQGDTPFPVNTKHVPQVTVGPLIERPREPDAGLDGHDTA